MGSVGEGRLQDFAQLHLSLHALFGRTHDDTIRLRMVKNQVMLLRVDSGSLHSFVNATFVAKLGIKTVPTPPDKVKVPDGSILLSTAYVPQLA